MKIFKSKHNLQKEILNIKNISFVPTMGGLHKGHISLIKKSFFSESAILPSNAIILELLVFKLTSTIFFRLNLIVLRYYFQQ